MSVVKKVCTNVGTVGEEEESTIAESSGSKFQELSLEMVVKIFNYVNLSTLVNLNTECRLFRKAIAINTRDKLLKQKKLIDCEVLAMWQNLHHYKYNIDRMYEVLIQLTFLQSDLQQFYILVWRYVNNLAAWSYLARYILPIIDEIDREVYKIKELKDNWSFFDGCRIVHPRLQEFINNFNDKIEIRINENCGKNHFFVKFIDIITFCPAANYYVSYEQTNKLVTKIEMYLELRNIPYAGNILNDFNENLDDYHKEVQLMKYLQRSIRFANMIYVNELLLTYLPNCLCYYMDCKGYIYYSIAGWFRCTTIRYTNNQTIDLSIQNVNPNIKKYIFKKNVDYQTYACGLFGKIVMKCSPDLQPITFNELYKKGLPFELINNSNDKNNNLNCNKKLKRTRNKFFNEFNMDILEDIGSIDKKKVRETRWIYYASINEYNKTELRHNFYG